MLTQSEQSCVASSATFLPSPTPAVFFLNVYGLRCGLCLLPVALDARGWEPVHRVMAVGGMHYNIILSPVLWSDTDFRVVGWVWLSLLGVWLCSGIVSTPEGTR